jgi:hypothetical protein
VDDAMIGVGVVVVAEGSSARCGEESVSRWYST